MRVVRFRFLTLVLLLAPLRTYAQQPTFHDTLLDHLIGKWVLQGAIAGQETVHDVTAEWVLAHQYVWIHEVSRETGKNGEPAYEANVYIGWDQQNNKYACVWLDVYGGISQTSFATAKREGNQIPFIFKDSNNTFHTSFSYNDQTNGWEWRMDSEQNGALKPFARVKLTKK